MKKKIFRTCFYLVLFFLLTAFIFDSKPVVSKEDRQYISLFLKEWNISSSPADVHKDFESEYSFISRVQDSVVGKICHAYVSTEDVGSVKKYYELRHGFCYDRAVMLEKFFLYYGFAIRHIYVYYRSDDAVPDRSDFFKKGLRSHALVEVKTKRGWMVVGTNSNWLGVQKDGQVLSIFDVRAKLSEDNLSLLKKSDRGVHFFEGLKSRSRFKILYGVYSRHGDFFRSGLVESAFNYAGIHCRIPDYNLRMLLYNF